MRDDDTARVRGEGTYMRARERERERGSEAATLRGEGKYMRETHGERRGSWGGDTDGQ